MISVCGDNREIEPVSEDRLMLDEHLHRTANEATAALAALRRISRPGTSQASAHAMLAAAIERLEGFGESSRLLGKPMGEPVDAGLHLARVCHAVVRGRPLPQTSRLMLDLVNVEVNGETARCLGLVAHELITNALKYALVDGGSLEVRLQSLEPDLLLSIIDEGPGLGSGAGSLTSGTRLGGKIVGELVRRAGGSMDCDTGPNGTAIHVLLPMHNRPLSRANI